MHIILLFSNVSRYILAAVTGASWRYSTRHTIEAVLEHVKCMFMSSRSIPGIAELYSALRHPCRVQLGDPRGRYPTAPHPNPNNLNGTGHALNSATLPGGIAR